MRKDKLSKQNIILYLCGIIPVVWLGLLIAPCMENGLVSLIQEFGTVMENPFQIKLCEDSVKTVLVLLLVYGIAIGVYLSTEHNYRRREEHGSARWGSPGSVNKKYADKRKTENKLLTQNVAIGLDGRKHRRNLNVLVCGGSGAGKTRFFAKPNIMNANTSFVVLDPKGELLRDTGNLLKEQGYDIKILDLINMEKSHCYNPFVYLHSDDDIQRLTTNLFKNTTPKGSQTQDPFWDQTAAMLLKALVCYLHYEAPPDEQNFPMVMEMIRSGDVKEDNEEYQSVLDELFERLEAKNPEHIALKYYRAYHSGSAKTLKSIQISLVSRLEKFNLDSLAGITQIDEMELESIGEKKTAVFAVIPDNDSSFNFIVGMLYTQLFQQLYYQADSVHGGRLPVHVHFVMDEFANVALPDEFDKLLSTMRSREIYKAAVAAAKAIAAAIKAIIAAIEKLIAAIAAGGWVAVVVAVVICLVALIVGSCFGIFFSSEDKNDGSQTMREVVVEINQDYQNQLDTIKANNPYDDLEMSGSRAVWPEVLSVYAVKTTTDPDNPQEVASVTEEKKQLLTDIFWEMNDISYRTETDTETEIIESDDGNGNILEETVEVTKTTLYITVSHKTAEQMSDQYRFNDNQDSQLDELLNVDNSMWLAVLYGIYGSDDMIVQVALSQIGNVGGEPYWSWYGFGSRVEWCECFVSWCADQ